MIPIRTTILTTQHNFSFKKLQFLISTLWDQETVGSSPAARTKTASFPYENWRF